jgi:hypothetical protein
MKYLTILLLFFISNKVISQLSAYPKVLDAYGEEWTQNQITNNNNELLQFLTKYSEKGFLLEQVSIEKTVGITEISKIPTISKNNDSISISDFLIDYNSQNFNPLKYQFFPANEEQIYHLSGTNFIIRIKNLAYLK